MDLFKETSTDLNYLEWTLSRATPGTAGTFLKAYEEKESVKYYYKMSNYDSVQGIYGHESINEIVAQNIAEVFGIAHLHYDLVYCKVNVADVEYITRVTKSKDFKNVGESKLTFESYYDILHLDGESIWDFITRMSLEDYFYDMFIFDYVICNRDRHGANIEVLEKNGSYRLAPLFDNGLSLMFSCYNDGQAMLKFDKLKQGPVNNYVGSSNLADNLKLVPKKYFDKVCLPSRGQLFKGLNMTMHEVPEQYWDCIYEMVKERVNHVKKIQDSKSK